MKKILFMLLALIVSVVAKAQEVQTVYDITVTAQDDKSGIWLVIGEDNLANVEELTLTGTINGYDFMIMRDKMTNLRKLDMTNVRIVANDYQYYSGYHSLDDILTGNAFYQKSSLREVKLPETITSIGPFTFAICSLSSIEIPANVESIEDGAFGWNSSLTTVDFSRCKKLKRIKSDAFKMCPLTSIKISESIKTIGSNAFYNTTTTLSDVYVQPIIPRTIPSNVFNSNLSNVTLHVPPMTKYDYYWATTWSGFGTIVEDVNPDYFYVDADLTIAEGKADEKTVDADVEANGGIINEDSHNQAFDEVNVVYDGTSSGSLIANDNITANDLCFNINVTGYRWHFFSFPFRISLNDVVAPGAFVFRRYNGSTRASGSSGWENLPIATECLEPGVGYIFQCNKSGTLKISVASPNFNWAAQTTTNTLTAYSAASDQDASWNFVGNPLTSYYDIDDLSYNSPLTVWNGSNYVAYRPGDDNYQLHPFEAFFVQKPEGNTKPVYTKTGRMTYTQATNHHNEKAAARRMVPGNRDRCSFLLPQYFALWSYDQSAVSTQDSSYPCRLSWRSLSPGPILYLPLPDTPRFPSSLPCILSAPYI